jgi:hypothetical protein
MCLDLERVVCHFDVACVHRTFRRVLHGVSG